MSGCNIETQSWDDDAQYERLAQSLNVIEVPCVVLPTLAFVMHCPLLNLPPRPSLRCITTNNLLPTTAKKKRLLGSNIVAIWKISCSIYFWCVYVNMCMLNILYSNVFGCMCSLAHMKAQLVVFCVSMYSATCSCVFMCEMG